jgi:hypothetical protein
MAFKIFAGVVALLLLVAFVTPHVLKLKDIPLGIVVAAGIVMMLVDLWQSLKSKDD